ncbi:MAG: hypothetical protein ABI411_19560 [Tahibacter sp.]
MELASVISLSQSSEVLRGSTSSWQSNRKTITRVDGVVGCRGTPPIAALAEECRNMKAKVAAVLLVVGFGSAYVFAESPCIECRKAALLETQACMANAKTDAEKNTCTKRAQELSKSCDNGVCKI